MIFRQALAAVVVLLMLAGCSAAPEPQSSPEPANPNEVACSDFSEATGPLLSVFVPGYEGPRYRELLDGVDSIGLRASGDVKQRISAVVTGTPNEGDILVYEDARVQLNDLLAAVGRACAAEGFDIEVNAFVIG